MTSEQITSKQMLQAALNLAANTIELFDDATMQAGYMLDAGECAGIIRALLDSPLITDMTTTVVKAPNLYKQAFDEFYDKTEWINKTTFPFPTLGLHRADILRMEIERLRAQLSLAQFLLNR